MGMRLNMVNGRAARLAAAVLAAVTMLACIGVTSVYADGISASEIDQEIAQQEAEEQRQAAQKEADQQAALAAVNEQLTQESAAPGKATYLRATTSTSTKGISAADQKAGLRKVTLKWTKAENATSYEVYWSNTKDGQYTLVKGAVETNKKKNMLFKNNKEVFLKVRAYNGDTKGKMSESVVIWPGYGDAVNATKIAWSSTSSVIYTGQSATFKVNSTASMLKTYKIKWSSSDKSVATVNKSGKVTAVADGKATITARSHAGFKITQNISVQTIKPSEVPDVVGVSVSQAKKAIKAAGFKVSVKRQFIKAKDMNKKYPGVKMGQVMKQNKKKGTKLSAGSTIKITYGDEIYDCGKGAEAMVKWAETVAADNSYGYSMGVYTGRGLDRLCPYTNDGASKDYDCATFVNAALAYSGMGDDFMKATVKPSPVVRGVRDLMKKNGWKKVTVKYKKNGKTYYRKPNKSELKRGDVLVNTSCHIQIHVGNGYDVGAHNNYDGKTGDSSGREVSVNYTWTGYAEVYRYYGKIGLTAEEDSEESEMKLPSEEEETEETPAEEPEETEESSESDGEENQQQSADAVKPETVTEPEIESETESDSDSESESEVRGYGAENR